MCRFSCCFAIEYSGLHGHLRDGKQQGNVFVGEFLVDTNRNTSWCSGDRAANAWRMTVPSCSRCMPSIGVSCGLGDSGRSSMSTVL